MSTMRMKIDIMDIATTTGGVEKNAASFAPSESLLSPLGRKKVFVFLHASYISKTKADSISIHGTALINK